jgi:uncharacterized membrane protein YcaP (DUF421 family)
MISTDLWHVQIPLLEKVIRTVLVYGGLAVLLRLAGKRDLAQLNSFDLVVMLLLSNVVQNAVIGSDNSVSGGLLGAAVLVAINGVTVRVVNRSPRLVKWFEGSDTLLVDDGRPLRGVITRVGLRIGDIAAALRAQGANDVSEVRRAVLSPGGAVVVTLKEDAQDVTLGDLRRFHEQLRETIRRDVRAEIRAALAGSPAASTESGGRERDHEA